MRNLRLLAQLLGLHLLAASAVAQSVQFDQTVLLYSATNASLTSGYLKTNTFERGVNYRSGRGVAISNAVNTTNGSDGRGFATQTPNQFRGMIVYGAVTRPPVTGRANLITSSAYASATNAVNLDLSRGTNTAGGVVLILRAAQVGAPYLSRAVSFLFGGIITPPATTESGTAAAAGYWLAEPFTTNGHAGAAYYWSPHAGAVFAAQAGPLYITWMKATPSQTQPTNGTAGVNYTNIGGLFYTLTNANYVISGSAAKTTRKLYWTEGAFRATGKPVSVPAARVSAVKVAYNNAMPERVATEYVAVGQSLITAPTNMLQELRTLWYDQAQGQIFAYNREGRALLELLGDSTGGEIREHLGYEIVDVVQQPTPTDLTTELGEKIRAYADATSDAALNPEPLQGQAAQPFLYRQAINGSDRTEYYAARETVNQNDALVHWLEAGVQGLRWPLLYARYQLVWPADVARYSHYVRPLVATEAEAKLTAVALPTENVPVIQYQDPLDYPRGKLSETFAYYTFLDASQPAHRALLRFTAGDKVAFERVLSVLRTHVLDPAVVAGETNDSVLRFDPRFLAERENKFTITAWTSDPATTGIRKSEIGATTLWAASIGKTEGSSSSLNGITVAGYLKTTTNSNFELSGPNAATTDSNAISGAGGANGELAGKFAYGGNPTVLTLLGLVVGQKYVASFLSVGWEATGRYQVFTSDNDSGTINQDTMGTDQGIRIDYLFTATGPTKTIRVTPVVSADTLHLYGLSLATQPAGQLPWERLASSASTGGDFPRFVQRTTQVGDRIEAPAGEAEAKELAGYILDSSGTSYHPGAYNNPFVNGFETAKLGAIIPVNAIPGMNTLEVWWFRSSSTNAASSGVKTLVNGFKPIYWPAVIGRYTLQWPSAPSEIVLASNDGSGALPSLQAKGTIYVQNDPTLPGYNPNEEHALMLGGQAYALRDDLNLTANTMPAVLAGAGATYSSQPFVLLDYTESDSRPAMRAFKVLREKPSAGIVFDYIVQAGANQSDKSGAKPLQAPMPLPFLPAPVEYVTNGVGAAATITKVNYNTEPSANSGDLPVNWASADQVKYANYKSFTYRDRKDQFWVMRGVHAGLPALAAGKYTGAANASTISFATALSVTTAVVNQPFTNTFHVSRPAGSLVMTLATNSPALPNGLTINGLTLTGMPTAVSASNTYSFVVTDIGDSTSVTVTLPLTVTNSGSVVAQGPVAITSVNQYAANASETYTGRPPFLAVAPTPANSFTMRFYYKTQEGFAWPGDTTPPAIGSIVPYLRPAISTADPGAKTTPALDIVYRPVWPGDPPKLQFGESLMAANAGRPAVRGQTSVQLLYQQSISTNVVVANASVVLHDPTREKSFALKTNSTLGLDKLPDGVKTDSYQGKTYFPNLPPHLSKRLYLDPSKGPKGALVFLGEYQEQGFSNHDWVLLNVLRGDDLASVKGLCPASPVDQKSRWDTAIDSLATSVETFYENPQVPGQFIVNSNLTTTAAIGTLTEITDDDTAVDSYALSASGPGQGYVTMIVGNGGAFTPAEEPVSLYVLRVTGSLFSGELKIIPNENPLSELISFQHNADLAGRFDEYEYEWKINPPVDGLPPATDVTMSLYQALTSGTGVNRYTMGGSGIQGLVDNYIVMRYRPKNSAHPLLNQWSAWTDPQLVEGWIKRVLAKINPFNQRVTDLYNNSVNTDASILTSAGKRWEGDIALNMDTINNYGLIEIYETILRRGRSLSIDAGINFGPANDALLLAAGYLNDLYMLVGNEAYADAANPTIGIGTKDKTYGDIATALFAFKGQVPSLLEEELGLLRGRDDFLQPGVDTGPVYNRFVWNYTRGIDAGEVIYALNYNVLDQNNDGKVDAADAMKLYPQGHGDAYGHYLTAVKGYYSLMMNNKFDWVPRSETVTILGKAVQVDYLDERKFAAAASAVARTGRQVFDLTWRRDYQAGQNTGWEYLGTTRINTSRTVVNGAATSNVVREWGADQWASRTGQGSFLNWVVGNAILPDVDPDTSHEGIQKIDRTTVPELKELAATGGDLQTALDNAEGRLTPLGLAPGSLAFDINPNQGKRHAEHHLTSMTEKAEMS